MKLRKSNLDERQEEQLLRIEEKGCWFAFWALLLSMFVQLAVFGVDVGDRLKFENYEFSPV